MAFVRQGCRSLYVLKTVWQFPVRRSFSNNIGYYAGVGTGWDINQHWSVGVNYTYYGVNRDPSLTNGQFAGTRVGLDTNTLTASAEYRF